MQFKQSVSDFPMTVSLGKKAPDWEISRWGDNSRLRFVPLDDEGFKLRGDRRRLVYKGRLRSHRISILGDSSFEYDCILEREPESNVVTLLLEGAEQYDFLRQPDFVKNPFLRGSYAVYKKETLVGEGTGKLCHIHRPLIIDGRGRRCWGDLSIEGNELRITIPEKWLGKAKYPVIVDPTVGTATVGSQTLWDNDPPEPWVPLRFECEMPVNRFLVPETIDGNCTAYFYTDDDYGEEAGGFPIFYSDNANKPSLRKSQQEEFIDFTISGSNPKGWRNGTLSSVGSIAAGSYIWFGCFTKYFWYPRFDFGGTYFNGFWSDENVIPGSYPVYWTSWPENFKFSMYFDYSSAQNYVRTLTQGVTLTDSRTVATDYQRTLPQTVCGSGVSNAFASFFRQCVMNAANIMSLSRIPAFIRFAIEQTGIIDSLKPSRDLYRHCDETTEAKDEVWRSQGFIRNVTESIKSTDNSFYPVVFVRSVSETSGIADTFRQWGTYIRGLYNEAGSLAETLRQSDYHRAASETVQADGSVFRGLLIFVRILTTSLVRDFFIRRFLIAREELVLKSCITKEMQIESKIN